MSTASTTVETTSRKLVVFSLGEEEYALPIIQVQEIIHCTEPRSLACDAAWIRGVISLRGRIIPVCDLAARIGVHARGGKDAKIVIVETGSATAGVVVDDVKEVLTVTSDQVEGVPAGGGEAIDGIAKIDDRLVVLLDAEGLFADVDLAA